MWWPMIAAAGVASSIVLTSMPAIAQQAAPDRSGEMVDVLEVIFGKHKVRASYAKGQCVSGMFYPTARATQLSSSVIFQRSSRVLGRFSMGGGNPTIPDSTKMQPRGLAIQIDPKGPGETHFAPNASPMQPGNTVEEWIEDKRVRFPGPDGKSDPQKLAAFHAAKPHTKSQSLWLASRPVPASYATTIYWAVHGYTATNAAGQSKVMKIKFMPVDGEYGLTDAEAAAKPRDWLVADLEQRMKQKDGVAFNMLATLARPTDKTNQPAVLWDSEETRPTINLGKLVLDKLEKNELCDVTYFDATHLANGLAGPKDDELFVIRQRVYANSSQRRDPQAKLTDGNRAKMVPTAAAAK